MNQVNLLRQTLKPLLGWHGARLSFLALFLIVLIEPVIQFRLRIRESDRIFNGKKQLRASIVFAHLQPGQTRVLSGKKLVWGRLVYVSALRLDSGELLIVITPESCPTAVSDYGKRWGIETLFGMFKTRGFCLESTHFRDSERLSKLVALMTRGLKNRQSCASATI